MATFAGNQDAGQEFWNYDTVLPLDTPLDFIVEEVEEGFTGNGNEKWKARLNFIHPVSGKRPGARVNDTIVLGYGRDMEFLSCVAPDAIAAIRRAGQQGGEVNIEPATLARRTGRATIKKESFTGNDGNVREMQKVATYIPSDAKSSARPATAAAPAMRPAQHAATQSHQAPAPSPTPAAYGPPAAYEPPQGHYQAPGAVDEAPF